MAYKCDHCNLDFYDFEHYLHHDCKFKDEQVLSQVFNDNLLCTNAFISFKTSRETHKSNVVANEGNQCMLTGNSVEDRRLVLDFLKCSENQPRKEKPNEKALLLDFNNLGYCSEVQSSANQKNQKTNLNQPSTSFALRQISENYAQTSSIPPLLSPELSPFPLSVRLLDPHCNTNQDHLSVECSQRKYYYSEMNPQVKPMMYKISSPSHELYENDLILEACSKRNRSTLNSVDQSKTVWDEPKYRNNECYFQRDMNITLKTQMERGTQNKMLKSVPLPMKCSNVYLKKTPTEQYLSGLSLSSK
ncbi:zinc finger protein [Trichonephila clavipes]|nr:zinc finger protein [Trichonephila clavipes]